MGLLRSIYLNFQEKGFARTLTIIIYRLGDFRFDLNYGTDTTRKILLKNLAIESENKNRGNTYQPTMAAPFSRLLDRLALSADSVLVDFGCGKGRVLLLAALGGIKKAVGIEFSPQLCDIARNNVAIVEKKTGQKLDIDIINADVCQYGIEAEQNVFFLFNPFDEVILKKVAGNILKSLSEKNREIKIIYYNPIHTSILDDYFKKAATFLIAGEEYVLYTNH